MALMRTLQDMETAVQGSSRFLSATSTAPPTGYVPPHSITPTKEGRKEEKDLMNGVAVLLHALEKSEGEPLIYWIHRAHGLSLSLRCSGFLGEALSLRRILHPLVYNLYLQHEDIYASDLALSYYCLSRTLSDNKKHNESLTKMQSSMDIRRVLAEKNHIFIPTFATSVHGTGYCLYMVGRYKEGIRYMQEAIDIWLKLVQKEPESYQTDLALSYHWLGFLFDKAGRKKERIEPYRRAVETARVAVKNTSATETMAASLYNLALSLLELKRPRDALPFAQEAVDVYQELEKNDPTAYSPSVRMADHNLKQCLSKMKSANAYRSLKVHLGFVSSSSG